MRLLERIPSASRLPIPMHSHLCGFLRAMSHKDAPIGGDIRQLTGLRGIAVLDVALRHYGLNEIPGLRLFSFADPAVNLFFCLFVAPNINPRTICTTCCGHCCYRWRSRSYRSTGSRCPPAAPSSDGRQQETLIWTRASISRNRYLSGLCKAEARKTAMPRLQAITSLVLIPFIR